MNTKPGDKTVCFEMRITEEQERRIADWRRTRPTCPAGRRLSGGCWIAPSMPPRQRETRNHEKFCACGIAARSWSQSIACARRMGGWSDYGGSATSDGKRKRLHTRHRRHGGEIILHGEEREVNKSLTKRGTPRLGPKERQDRQIAGWQRSRSEDALSCADWGWARLQELFGRPRLTKELLQAYKDGLIAKETVIDFITPTPVNISDVALEGLWEDERGLVAELCNVINRSRRFRWTDREIIALVKEIIGYKASIRARKGWRTRRYFAKMMERAHRAHPEWTDEGE